MFFDLNVPAPTIYHQPPGGQGSSKKGKAKQPPAAPAVAYSAAQLAALDARVDLLVHCQSRNSVAVSRGLKASK